MPADEITPEQRRLWEGFVRSNPSRVIHALVLGFRDQPNQWGDTIEVGCGNPLDVYII